jgi:site-specific DNA recombinase
MPAITTEKPSAGARTAQATKRAFAYLRVSSDGQVKTDYSDDGLSINVQRDGAIEKASGLDAEIVGEFSDPGRSAYVDLHKRTGFLEMLDELKRRNEHVSTRVDYVIVWSLSRWARNTVDHWQTRKIVSEAGARLISITEPMAGEDSAAAFLYESMIATHNQFQSMLTSEGVKHGLKKKASVGGTYGPAPFGYLNDVDVLPDGRRVAVVVIDPDRGHYVTLAFQLYASGEYSIPQLADELERLGVRSRPTKRWPATKFGTSVLQRLLRNRYYVGKIVYKKGTPDEQVFDGRHDALIDQDTFDRVQSLLDEKRVAGERPKTATHYLRGSVYCDECGERLVYAESTGRNGRKYPYFFCIGRVKRNGCTQRANIRPELIEVAIQRYYHERPVQLTAEQVRRRTEAVEALVGVSQDALRQVQQAKRQLIQSLETRQDALLEMRFAEKSISPSLFKRKQDKLQAELDAAHESLTESNQRLRLDGQQLRMALELAGDVAEVYAGSSEQTKRGYNQAFFVKLFVRAEWDEDASQTHAWITHAELTPPYAALLAENFAEDVLAEAETIKAQADAERAPESRSGSPKPVGGGAVSYYELMAEREGFEPSNEVNPRYAISSRARSTAPAPLQRFSLVQI